MPRAILSAIVAIGAVVCCVSGLRAQPVTCAADAARDWMVETMAAGTSSAPIRPADCATVEQTPPDFSWPDHGPGARYEFSLTLPNGTTRRRVTARNWIAWDEALPPGVYQWRVRVLPGAGEVGDHVADLQRRHPVKVFRGQVEAS